jgi:phage terminase large subunit-like protein
MAARPPVSSAEPPLPACGYVLDDDECTVVGEHVCEPRVAHAEAFFAEILVHTKGDWARQRFTLRDWQRDELIRPIFGPVRWDASRSRYVRRIRIVWIELARKQGKSEILAGIALYLLCGDGEEGAEIYGAALDRDQARKVYDVAARMVELSPVLTKVLRVRPHEKRIVHAKSGSYYQIVAGDVGGNLGHNPHAIVFDETATQRDGELWGALRTGMGVRAQPLMVSATTPGNDPGSWCAGMHAEMVRVAEDPTRAPHTYVYLRNTPPDADPWDEANWYHANPALGQFLSIDSLREEAIEARNDPSKENLFRQFRLAQWVQQATRWMPIHVYNASSGEPWPNPVWRYADWKGRTAWAGLDLSAKHDLTAFCLTLPAKAGGAADAMWRFWLPEDAYDELDRTTSGKAGLWVKGGWLTLTEGSVVDYDRVYDDITADAKHFRIREIAYDKWSGEPVRQAIEERTGVTMVAVDQTYTGMTAPMTDLMSVLLTRAWHHHGNPVAAWNFDAIEVKRAVDNPELIRPVKPKRRLGDPRIDGVVAAALSVGGWKARGHIVPPKRTAYAFGGR